METLSLYDARARFSELVRRAERGESIALTRHGHVVARLVPPPSTWRQPGLGRGTIEYRGDLELTEEEIDEFYVGQVFATDD